MLNKKHYHVRNWREYNKSLMERGNITFWFDEAAVKGWHATQGSGRRGRPLVYSDVAIECGLTLKALFKLPFRMTEGFILSLIRCLNLRIQAPHYSLLCKRQRDLKVALPKKRLGCSEKIHLVVDTTGLKIYGEGEWQVRQRRWQKRRVWRKLHLGVNVKTHEIEAFALTDLGVQDWEGFPLLLSQIDGRISSVIGDGGYDKFPCYEAGYRDHFAMIAPPQRDASTSEERSPKMKRPNPEVLKARDAAIKQVREQGRQAWKVAVGYHRRSLAETAMYRVKTLLSNRLSSRKMENQRTEVAVWCKVMNKMTSLGMPESVAL